MFRKPLRSSSSSPLSLSFWNDSNSISSIRFKERYLKIFGRKKKFPCSKGIHHFENKKIEYRRVQIKTARIKYQLDFDPYLFHENLLETKGAVSRGTANATTKPRSIIPVTRSFISSQLRGISQVTQEMREKVETPL